MAQHRRARLRRQLARAASREAAARPRGSRDHAGIPVDGSTENSAHHRQAEIKRGRAVLLAAMGYIIPEITGKPPGLSPPADLKFADVPSAPASEALTASDP
eukprot:571685-Heterocapsa_arctica.AAC.1